MKQDQKLPLKIKGQATSKSGQAVVEYLLLAVVTVGLILGMKSVFTKLNDGANKYMGDYIVCLMEFGELPTLGVAAQDLNKHAGASACDSKFAAFSLDEGRPSVGGGAGQTGGTGSSSTNSNNASNSNSNTNRNGSDKNSNSNNSKSDGSGDGGSASELAKAGSGGSGSGSGNKSTNKSGQVRRSSTTYGTNDGGSGDSGRSRVIDEDGDDDSSGPGGKKNRRQGRRGRNYTTYYGENYRAITGGKAFDAFSKQLKKTQARKPTSTIRSIAKEDGRFLQSNRKEITPQEPRKPLVQSTDDDKFTFGNLIRWLMIAGMVIAIVIFFGGQIMNYSNSGE